MNILENVELPCFMVACRRQKGEPELSRSLRLYTSGSPIICPVIFRAKAEAPLPGLANYFHCITDEPTNLILQRKEIMELFDELN